MFMMLWCRHIITWHAIKQIKYFTFFLKCIIKLSIQFNFVFLRFNWLLALHQLTNPLLGNPLICHQQTETIRFCMMLHPQKSCILKTDLKTHIADTYSYQCHNTHRRDRMSETVWVFSDLIKSSRSNTCENTTKHAFHCQMFRTIYTTSTAFVNK